ncbi:MAG: GTP 3',8-cyclase MoaA, partial [Lachnospiraceae bacterium]|nr:GTP 3',8-cyclase MoaA [Lachnospiraceae bacterium]
GADISPDTVLSGIDAAAAAGLKVKINSVLTDINKDSWPGLAELAKFRDVDVRFIELMPIGSGKEYVGVSNRELMDKLSIRFGKPERVDAKQGNGPACYRRFPGFKGSIGFISAIHGKFCDSCNRIRLTSSGILKSCLCYDSKLDLLARIRSGATEEELAELICEAIMNKPEAHCFEVPGQISEKRSMSQIGG